MKELNIRLICAADNGHNVLLVCCRAAGDYESVDGDDGENADSDNDDDSDDDDDDDDDGDSSDRDKDDDRNDVDDDGIQPAGADGSDDAGDSNDAEFNAAHRPLQGTFKTAEGITVTIVKGSIASQKVCVCHSYYNISCRVTELSAKISNM